MNRNTYHQAHIPDRNTTKANHVLYPPLALPPLSLPLPAPCKRTGSDHTEPESIILTPIEDEPIHQNTVDDAGGDVSEDKAMIRVATPYPPKPGYMVTIGQPRLIDQVISLKPPSGAIKTKPSNDHPQSTAIPTHVQKDSRSVYLRKVFDITSVIEQVYTAYTRLPHRVQSPILLLSLRQFRDRSTALKNASRNMGRISTDEYRSEELLSENEYERYVILELQRLEEGWWASEVVANWFGPLPRGTKRPTRDQGQAGGGTGRVQKRLDGFDDESDGDMNDCRMERAHCPDLGVIDGIGGGTMTERAVDLRRLSSFVGLWDE